MRQVLFHAKSFNQFSEWMKTDAKIAKKILELIEDAQRNPFQGLGKPEELKHDLKGYWSRRITDEHRLVYSVTDDFITVVSCRYHYAE